KHGIKDRGEGATFEEIANKLNISRQRAHEVYKRAINKLQRLIDDDEVFYSAKERRNNRTQKEINEVRQKYEGTDKWLKSPNSKPTNLTEEQWLTVRTPAFKKWFGDWELAAELTLPTDIKTRQDAQNKIKKFINTDITNKETNITAKISTNQLGKLLSEVAINKSLENGFTREEHLSAASIVDKLFENAVLLNSRPDRNNDVNIKSIKEFAAPIITNNGTNFAYMTLKESIEHGHRIYTIELQEIKKPQSIVGTPHSSNARLWSNSIIKQLQEKINASKVVDENNEPLVVYHGARSTKKFSVFHKGSAFFTDNYETAEVFKSEYAYKVKINGQEFDIDLQTAQDIKNAIDPYEDMEWIVGWNIADSEITDEQRANLFERLDEFFKDRGFDPNDITEFKVNKSDNDIFKVFLNIRNPKIVDYGGRNWGDTYKNDKGELVDVIIENDFDSNNDGLIAKNLREGGLVAETLSGEEMPIQTTYVVFDPSQIKSVNNRGTFDKNNPDIYYSPADRNSSITSSLPQSPKEINPAQTENQQDFKLTQQIIDLIHKHAPKSKIAETRYFPKKNILGMYDAKTANIMTRALNNMSVAIHETVHAIDDADNYIDSKLDGKDWSAYIRELREIYLAEYSIAKPLGDKPVKVEAEEGLAMLLQRALGDEAETIKKYGAAYEKTMQNPKFKSFMKDARDILKQYQSLDPLAKIGARIVAQKKEINAGAPFLSLKEKFVYQAINRWIWAEKLDAIAGATGDNSVNNWLNLNSNIPNLIATNIEGKGKGFWGFDRETDELGKVLDFNYTDIDNMIKGRELSFDSFLAARRDNEQRISLKELQQKTRSTGELLIDIFKKAGVNENELTDIINNDKSKRNAAIAKASRLVKGADLNTLKEIREKLQKYNNSLRDTERLANIIDNNNFQDTDITYAQNYDEFIKRFIENNGFF
ncbi:MAG: hypothetical protein LBV16_00995, partial [Elusimicrobiota bacterium]|nr:hypothetical protein [Elusimicrobiota bacterium]